MCVVHWQAQGDDVDANADADVDAGVDCAALRVLSTMRENTHGTQAGGLTRATATTTNVKLIPDGPFAPKAGCECGRLFS